MAVEPATPTRPRRAPAWMNHAPEALSFSHRAGEVYFFTAPSASVPGKVNTVAYDPTDRSTHCDCFAGERGLYECWHAHHAEGAWLLNLCRQLAGRLSDAELELAGKEAAARAVMQRLGHTQFATTMDNYSHIMPAMQREALELMGRLLAAGE